MSRYKPKVLWQFAAVLRSIGGIVDGDHPIMNGELDDRHQGANREG
jgi:hypothetical protein